MSELTQVDGTRQNVAIDGDEKDWDADADRWTKGDNDRLYVDGCKFVNYVSLDSLIVLTKGSGVDATAEIDGDELTLEITRDDGINHVEWTATFALPDDLAEETDDAPEPREVSVDDTTSVVSESETVVATDGGDATVDEAFTDEEIQETIDNQDSEADIEDVRDVLQTVQQGFETLWLEHMDSVEDGALEVVAADGHRLVFADHTGHFWNAEFDNAPLADRDLAPRMQSVVKQLHHEWARRHTDFDWGTVDPIVVHKPDSFDAGQRFVEAFVNGLQNEGLAPGQARAVYGVHVAGYSRNQWASMCGYGDHSAVSEALRKAEEKVGHLGIMHS